MSETMKQKATQLQIKQVSEEGVIEGYLNTFNHIDRAGDNTQKGAFVKSIEKINAGKGVLPMLYQHDHSKVVGVWTELKEDEHGLWAKGQLNLDTQLGRELYSNIKMGAVEGISIGYFEKETEYDRKSGSLLLKELELIEASIVLLPCNEQSNIETVKTLLADGQTPSKVQLEKSLRELGYSRNQAKSIIAQGYNKSFYEDGKIENTDDIYSFVFSKVTQLSPEDLRVLIDKLNEFLHEDEEELEELEELEEDIKSTEQIMSKAEALLNLLNK